MRSLRPSVTDPHPRRQHDGARRRELTWGQTLFVGSLLTLSLTAWIKNPGEFLSGLVLISQIGFLALAVWRIVLVIVAVTRIQRPLAATADKDLPRYTILAALYDEAEVVSQ